MEERPKSLYKSPENRVIDGVCGGLGEYLGIDPVLVRIAFVLGFPFAGGATFPLYIILMFVMPEHPDRKFIRQQRRAGVRGKYVRVPDNRYEKQKRKNDEMKDLHVAKPIRDYDDFRDKVKRSAENDEK